MGSRYALRGIESAIGYDCRRLEDGRRASFRHTLFHRRARMDFLERRDLMAVMQASLIATAGLASHYRIDPKDAHDTVYRERYLLYGIAFPYVDMSGSRPAGEIEEESYDEYFDELDRLEELRMKGAPEVDQASSGPSGVGGESRK